MGGIGVAVEQLERALRSLHQAFVDRLAHEHAAHRDGGVGDALGDGHQVGDHAELLGGERGTEAPEAGDDFVEDQQDAVLGADLAQALEIALRRRQVAGRTGAGLDDDGGDVRRVMQAHDAFERIGQFLAVLGLALGEGVRRQVRVRQVIDTRQHRAEPLAIVHHAAHGDAAEADTVIAALAADETRACALAVGAVIGERDLERRVHRLGTRVAIEGVVEVTRQHRGVTRGQLERLGMAHLKRRRIVHLVELLEDGRLDLLAAVPGIDAPQARRAVDDLAALRRPVVNALGLGQHPRVLLELPVRRERHEEGFEIVRGSGVRRRHLKPLKQL